MNTPNGGKRASCRPRLRAAAIAACLAVAVAPPAGLAGQHEHPAVDHESGAELSFPHGVLGESISPETGVSLGHLYADPSGGPSVHRGLLGAEYAISRGFSLVAHTQFDYDRLNLSHLELAVKAASYALERRGVLLGWGLGLDVPMATGVPEGADPHPGHGIARHTAHFPASALPGGSTAVATRSSSPEPTQPAGPHDAGWGLRPFLNLGFRHGAWDLMGCAGLGLPLEEGDSRLGYDIATVYRVGTGLNLLLELAGSGHGPAAEAVVLAPGLTFRPQPDGPLMIGLSTGMPLTDGEASGVQLRAHVFWHF